MGSKRRPAFLQRALACRTIHFGAFHIAAGVTAAAITTIAMVKARADLLGRALKFACDGIGAIGAAAGEG